jgi:LAO/AO transport system kinase
MDRQAIVEEVTTRAKEGKISCKEAQKVADEAGIAYKDMGTLLDELKIKIAGCQLGCFP